MREGWGGALGLWWREEWREGLGLVVEGGVEGGKRYQVLQSIPTRVVVE